MKNVRLHSFLLALTLGAGAYTVNFAGLPAVSTLAEKGTLPPIVSPTSPKKPRPVAHEKGTILADAGTVNPPIVVIGPDAPKKPGPVAHESDSTIADAGTVKPPIVVIGPNPPKDPAPVVRELES